jgi:hypothetical protein
MASKATPTILSSLMTGPSLLPGLMAASIWQHNNRALPLHLPGPEIAVFIVDRVDFNDRACHIVLGKQGRKAKDKNYHNRETNGFFHCDPQYSSL